MHDQIDTKAIGDLALALALHPAADGIEVHTEFIGRPSRGPVVPADDDRRHPIIEVSKGHALDLSGIRRRGLDPDLSAAIPTREILQQIEGPRQNVIFRHDFQLRNIQGLRQGLQLAPVRAAGSQARNIRVAGGSWFDALPDGVRFDVVVSNPPYVAEGDEVEPIVRRWEPGAALFAGPDGLDDIRRIVASAPRHLTDDGWLVLEIGAAQGTAVAALLGDAGLVDVEIRADFAGNDRIALGRRAAG